jgi:phosphoglycolate phosphatase-like HAD superfamily hydrolase
VAVHYEGYEKVEEEGRRKVKKKARKCYLGPQIYKYVEKLHELGLPTLMASANPKV